MLIRLVCLSLAVGVVATGAAVGAGVGILATAAAPEGAAVLSAQSVFPFQVATPFEIQLRLQVAAETD